MARMSAGAGYQYLLRHTACGDVHRDPSTPLTAYYTASGYPPGSWYGAGLAGLGITAGSTVTEEGMARLYGQGQHPATGAPLGRPYPAFRSTAQRIADSVAALPESMTDSARAAAVEAITRLEAARRPRVAVAGFDLTFTAPKSASVLWALAHPDVQALVVDAHRAAVRDALAFLEERALFTRIGHNSIAQVPTRGIVAALFDHWDTRTGDPNLHTHVVVANKVQGRDGVWRSLDSRALHHAAVAVSELYDNLLADNLTTALDQNTSHRAGSSWGWRDRGPRRTPAFELDVVTDDLLTEFSTRSAAIATAMTDALVDFHAEHGRGPNRVETTRLRQQLTTATRPAKTMRPLPELMAWWRDRARRLLRRAPHPLLAPAWSSQHATPAFTAVISRGRGGVRHDTDGVTGALRHGLRHGTLTSDDTSAVGSQGRRGTARSGGMLRSRLHQRSAHTARPSASDDVVEYLAAVALDAVLARRSTWTRWNLLAEAARATRGLRLPSAAERIALHDRVVATALAGCVPLTAPDRWTVPEGWRRPDGTTVFDRPDEDRFSHRVILDAEARLLAAAADQHAPGVDETVARAAAVAVQPPRHPGGRDVRLASDQVDAVIGIATSRRLLDVLVGPAGTGKTTTLRALRTAWEDVHGPGTVLGLAPSAAAAHELADALGVPCENTAKWLHESTGLAAQQRAAVRAGLLERRTAATSTGDARTVQRVDTALTRIDAQQDRWQLRPGTLLVVDEASLAGTLALDDLAAQAAAAGAKVLLVGDHHQLGAVDAGGAFGLLATAGAAHRLRSLWRFTHRWEAHATRALRDGHPGALATYDRHGRIHEGGPLDVLDAAYNAWAADSRGGASALLLAVDGATVAALNHRARTDRVAAGLVDDTTTVRLADGLTAGAGDVVVTRRNDRRLTTTAGGHVRNGTRWTLTTIHTDGSAELTAHSGTGPEGTDQDRVRVPADYVRRHLELGYATTIHRAQGLTVDHTHLLATEGMTREALYVGLTRGRHSNQVYVPVEPINEGCEHLPDPGRHAPDAHEQLRTILATTGRERSATEHLRDLNSGPSARERDAVRATLADTPPPYPAPSVPEDAGARPRRSTGRSVRGPQR
ncbi:MAG: MobF family relaxase [Candidatus Nanopelagicales bacterium]